jgi:hypothetical protein
MKVCLTSASSAITPQPITVYFFSLLSQSQVLNCCGVLRLTLIVRSNSRFKSDANPASFCSLFIFIYSSFLIIAVGLALLNLVVRSLCPL